MSADNGGATHYIYATQLESIYARELIPCFDEPQFKAKFQLTVVTPVWTYDTEVLSNMPNKQLPYPLNTGINSPIVHQFIESPPMPTYLLAIVIGELKKVSKTCGAPNSFYDASVSTDINVWSTPDKVGMLASALDIACSSMMTFAKTFDVPFPLPKLDIVGIPQFEDSMENWGLLIFRESMLLMDTSGDNAPTLGPDGDMEDMDMFQTFTITETIAHEVGHQWAGNLVTMNKWNELWLSEGLASYFQAIAADEYRPNYGFYDLIYVRQTSDALGMDSSVTTHALSSLSPVTQMSEMLRSYLLYSQDSSAPGSELGAGNSPLEVRRKLKQFSPSTQYPPGLPWFFAFPPPSFPFTVRHPPSPPPVKAASTPTMSPPSPPSTPAFSTTTDPFLKGIGKFFDTFRFQSVDYNQLWSSISETTGQPVGKWMEAWTTEKNYPVLDPIVRNTPGVSVGPVLYVTQRSVTAFSSASGCFDTSSSGRWWIPMSYRSMSNASGAVQWHAFDSCSAQFPLLDDQLGQMVPASGVNMCVLVNPGRLGFYRTQYTSECWYYLTQSASSFEKISAVDLGGLLDDALHFSKTGDLPITPFLELTKQLRLRLQPEFTPWSISLSWLSDALFKIQLATISNIEYLACARNIETYIKASTGSFLHGYHVPGRFLSGVNFDVLPSENIQLRMLRPLLMRASGRSGDGVLTAAAWKKLVSAIPKLDTLTGLETSIPAHSINPDVREVVYALSVMSGDPAAWESIRQMYIMSNDPADAQRLLSALTFITDAKSIGEVMGFLMSSDVKLTLGIQDGDSFYAVWTLFLGQRMDEIIEKYPSPQDAVYSLGGPLMEFGRYFVDDSLVGELQKFADNHANILNPNFMDSVKEGIAINSAWMKNNAGMLCSWMSRQ
eukprot:gene9795-7684_t